MQIPEHILASLLDLGHCKVFARDVCGLSPYSWQDDVYDAIEKPGSVCDVTACNESGKTSNLAAPIAVWHAETIPGSVTLYTSASTYQIDNQFLPAFRRYATEERGWTIIDSKRKAIYRPTGSEVYFYKSDDPKKMEGFHERGAIASNKSLLVIIDEAKSIPLDIYLQLQRCSATRQLRITSTDHAGGGWFRDESLDPKLSGRHFQRNVKYTDCPHLVDDAKKLSAILNEIEKFGIDHPFIRSKYFSEWPMKGGELVFDLDAVAACMGGMVPSREGPRLAALDLSGGGDEQDLWIAVGNRARLCWTGHETDEYALVRNVINVCQRNFIPDYGVYIDGTGLGRPYVRIFRELGWNVNSINFAESPRDKDLYPNRRAEMAYNSALKIRSRSWIIDNDDQTKKELGWYLIDRDSKGRLSVQPKEKMPGSPNRGDSLIMLLDSAPDYEIRKYSQQPGLAPPKGFNTGDENERFGGRDYND